jgi:hypothetical protein
VGNVTVKVNDAQVERVRQLLDPKTFKKAMQAALSRTIKPTTVKFISDQLAATMNLRASVRKGLVQIKLPSYDRLTGSIGYNRDRGVPAIEYMPARSRAFDAKTPRGGVRVTMRKRASGRYPGGQEKIDKGFLAAPPGGTHMRVMQRTGQFDIAKRGKRQGQRREKVRQVWGLTPAGAMAYAKGQNEETIIADAAAYAAEKLERNIESQLSRFLK